MGNPLPRDVAAVQFCKRDFLAVSIHLIGMLLALPHREGEDVMSLVRLLGYTTLSCGCVVGRYREVATSRELTYVEEKGVTCGSHGHRRNHTIAGERLATVSTITAKAS